jgi:hypothetical protein
MAFNGSLRQPRRSYCLPAIATRRARRSGWTALGNNPSFHAVSGSIQDMKIDTGSGGFKRPGYIGLDVAAGPAADLDVDIFCNIERDRWPVADNSVTHIFSSHCFEHIRHDRIPYVFQEMSRVSMDGAQIEIWNPYAFHRDGYVLGHINFLTEEIYHHVCGLQDVWVHNIGARWDLKEIRYHVPPATLAAAAAAGMSEDFAITHLNQVVKEFGVFIEVNKSRPPNPHAPVRMLVDEVPDPPMRETRELNRRPISTTLPVTQVEPELAQLRLEVSSLRVPRPALRVADGESS